MRFSRFLVVVSQLVLAGCDVGTAAIAVADVEIIGSSEPMMPGDSVQLTAVLTDPEGETLSDREVVWSSDNEFVATVSASGVVRSEAAGAALITASVDGIAGTRQVTVLSQFYHVSIRTEHVRLVPGGHAQLELDALGRPGLAPTDVAFAWASSDSTVATVDSSGRLLGISPGNATITVTGEREGVRASRDIVVQRKPPLIFHVIPLGTLGGAGGEATAMNERGQIVGFSATPGGKVRGFFWENGRMRELAAPSEFEIYPNAINEKGEIVGSGNTDTCRPAAFLWRNETVVDLLDGRTTTEPGCPYYVNAVDINDSGEVLLEGSPYGRHVWREGTRTAIQVPSGYPGRVTAINNKSEVLIEAFVPGSRLSPASRSFIWKAGSLTEIPWIHGGRYVRASDINDKSEVTGEAIGPPGSEIFREIFVSRDGTTTSLKVPGGGSDQRINDHGTIVGTGGINGQNPVIILNGEGFDLNQLLADKSWRVTRARAINNSGQIAGQAQSAAGELIPILLVPEHTN